MFDAVVTTRKSALHDVPWEAWTTTIDTLYAPHTVPERVPSGKQRYPKLREDEKYLHNTSWSFKNIMHLSKVKWSRLKPLNQWPDTSTPFGDSRGGASSTQVSQGQYADLIFNPAVYSEADIATLREQFLKPEAAPSVRRLQAGTNEEWK